ncbi:hypothetical protein C7M84_014693 [Penaeus vannamei]|uniref:Uncharacterized protein n=1 Tax=Penaeus vannamei TaxID=6689 RepID=A0A423SSS8_PENVA|nr:hypothetical protein C7M84_014693 [Penaeus vannamei]
MSGPFIRKEIVMKAPAPVMKSPGPISGPISGPINGPISGPINGPISGPFPGPRPSPFSGPIPGPIPMPGPMRGPIRVPFGGPLSSRIISGPLPIQSRRDGPFPFGVPRPIPLPASQALSKPQDEEDEEPRHRMLPFPFRPAVRMSPRFLPIVNLSPPAPELRNPPVPISSLRRGAVKIEDLPRPLPEAKGRALSSPVPLKFLPGRLLNSTPFLMTSKRTLPPRPVTHMEMQAEPKKDDPMLHIKDFGPPRTHTEIMSPPEPIAHITRMPPMAGTQIPSFPPPPRFHPEGRSSSVSEINPDAEMVVEGPASQGPPSAHKGPGEPRKHHLLILN